MAASNFDPKNVSVIFAGKIISGFGDGTFITAERNNDAFSVKVGVDGEGARSKSNDKSGKVTLTLIQSAQSNDDLSALAAADELSGTGAAPLFIKDNNGSTLVTALTAWIKKYASVEMSKEISMRQWVFETDELDMFVGGNNQA